MWKTPIEFPYTVTPLTENSWRMSATFGTYLYVYLSAMVVCEDIYLQQKQEPWCSLKFFKDFTLAGILLALWT